MVLREKALKGDARALDRVVELGCQFNNEPAETGSTQVVSADDRAMLDAYAAEIAAAAKASVTPEPRRVERVKLSRRTRSNKEPTQ
jgi:hypothetical protein